MSPRDLTPRTSPRTRPSRRWLSATQAGRPTRAGRACIAALAAAATVVSLSPAAQAVISGALPVATLSVPKAVLAPQAGRIPAAPGFAASVPQRLCDPVAKPGVSKFASYVLTTYQTGRNGGITRSCSVGANSEHKEGRAWDWMVNVNDTNQLAAATNALNWLMAPGPDGRPAWQARRVGIMNMIYNRKIWSSSRADEGWRPYSGTNPHTDHIHFSFSWAGAMGATEFWTGDRTPTSFGPCPSWSTTCAGILDSLQPVAKSDSRTAIVVKYQGTELDYGSRGQAVVALQTLLRMPQDQRIGVYGPKTKAALLRFKRWSSLGASTVVTNATWEALKYPYAPVG